MIIVSVLSDRFGSGLAARLEQARGRCTSLTGLAGARYQRPSRVGMGWH